MEDSTFLNGTVKFYNAKAKFGFIRNNENGEELYVKKSGLIDSVSEGDAVTYQVEQHTKGPKAINVKRVVAGE
ncbi:MAG: cold shock domain-containing protein [Flavobacteriales bacterium]|nr:cold shock domain-containing protein [Flavobacteriales bacterium]